MRLQRERVADMAVKVTNAPFTKSGDPLVSATSGESVLDRFPLRMDRKVRWLVNTIGEELVAVSSGQTDVDVVRAWSALTRAIPWDLEPKFELLFRVVVVIESDYDSTTAQQFLRGSNPVLHDQAPAVVIADLPIDECAPLLLSAVRSFIGR